jgi:hypothetical protein
MPTVDLSDPNDDENDWVRRLFSQQAQAPSAPAAPAGLSLNGQQQPAPLPSQASNIDWNAPPQPTFPANPADPRYSMPARIGSALAIEAGRIGRGLWSTATLPGDVATGKTTMADPEAQNRVMNLASTVTFGSGASAPEGALTTGWAPAAWKKLSQLKQEQPGSSGFIDGLANMTPDQARVMPPFSSPLHNRMLDDVINAHNDDLSLVNRVREGSPYASIPLREMRGQPFDDPGSAAALAPPEPSPAQTLQDFLYGGQSPAVQPPSTPWNTFRLEPPDMPPFPANDPRAAPPPAPPRPWPPPSGGGMVLRPGELGA